MRDASDALAHARVLYRYQIGQDLIVAAVFTRYTLLFANAPRIVFEDAHRILLKMIIPLTQGHILLPEIGFSNY